MSIVRVIPAVLLPCLLMAALVQAEEPAALSLEDVHGGSHRVEDWEQTPAVVLFFVATECPVANGYVPEMNRLREQYASRGVQFFAVYPDPKIEREIARSHAEEYKLSIPGVLDSSQEWAKRCGVRVTPEAAVLTSEGVVYCGRIDDRYAANGRRRNEPRTRDLQAAVDAVLAGKTPEAASGKAYGCPLPRPRAEN